MEVFDQFGQISLLERKKTAFLCSRATPPEYHNAIMEWAEACNRDCCVITGRASQTEREVSDRLFEKGIPQIWVASDLAEVKQEMSSLSFYLKKGILLILSLYGPDTALSRPQKDHMRNLAVIHFSDEVVVGYCATEGNLSRQLAACERYTVLAGAEDGPRYRDYLYQKESRLMLDTFSNEGRAYCRITQQRNVQDYIRHDCVVLDADSVVALRDMLDRAIESQGWGESRYNEVRETYPNAYRRWTPEDELVLRECLEQGRSDMEISEILGRQPSAVQYRSQKIIEEEASGQEG